MTLHDPPVRTSGLSGVWTKTIHALGDAGKGRDEVEAKNEGPLPVGPPQQSYRFTSCSYGLTFRYCMTLEHAVLPRDLGPCVYNSVLRLVYKPTDDEGHEDAAFDTSVDDLELDGLKLREVDVPWSIQDFDANDLFPVSDIEHDVSRDSPVGHFLRARIEANVWHPCERRSGG